MGNAEMYSLGLELEEATPVETESLVDEELSADAALRAEAVSLAVWSVEVISSVEEELRAVQPRWETTRIFHVSYAVV